ncbi:aminomethyltransferase family protein [Alkalibacter mobilis]|uniref:aminomethyltransferase family protein n=1 Tax=Alkalibacter mobilis TaxID=2787712 RepID=UPI00189FCE78|nr:aminomethyltransferase family protein [Alkalibacter mobilis]MBF7097693.1 aminomethyl transferase family protein [Alkalibacter mobilis]
MFKNVYKYDDMKRREHMAVRKTVGWYLWTHQLLEVKGNDADKFLDLIYPKSISNLKVGNGRYTTMLNEQAEIIDDVIVFRIEDQKFWVSTLFLTKLQSWLSFHKGDFNVEFENITPKYHMYAVQGPQSKDLINALADNDVSHEQLLSINDNLIDGIPVKISRAGFTGEKFGFEIYIPVEKADEMEKKIRSKGEPFGAVEITEIQIMAWTLPTEAGFYYMRDLMHTNPFEVGLNHGIDWEKNFIGKEALLEIKLSGPTREMVGFTMEESDVHIIGKDLGGPGAPVLLNGKEVGRVSKFNYSYVLEKCVGYILAEKDIVKPGDHVAIKTHDAVIAEIPFYNYKI